jgi:CxxC motif-containing protein (DUF1111 family)
VGGRRRGARALLRAACAAGLLAGSAAGAGTPPALLGRVAFADPFSPPPYRPLSATEQAQVALGQAVFNTQWLPAGTPGAGRRAGLGPLYNSFSCDSCHNSAKRGRGPEGPGPAPAALVIQLGTRAADGRVLPDGDPVYGRTLNTVAQEGTQPEGRVSVRYESITGVYADGSVWRLRHFAYEVDGLRYGPLAATTVLKPRLAPALFGLGLLQAAMAGGARARFGWQGDVPSIRDQTAKAFALEMGLTSSLYPHDDMTAAEGAAAEPSGGGPPEVAPELLDALVAFEETMAVPPAAPLPADQERQGEALFRRSGCAACHTPQRPVPGGRIAAYTDLALHDMGPGLADATVTGETLPSRWRTAPLWGIGWRGSHGRDSLSLLHDGRAATVEEAILWHGGEGRAACERFQRLAAGQRQLLARWVESR